MYMTKFFKGFKKKYPKWVLPTKIGIWLAIISLIIGLISLFNDFNDNSKDKRFSSSIQLTNEINSDESTSPYKYINTLTVTGRAFKKTNVRLNLLNVKMILPSTQETFLKKINYNLSYTIADCNFDYSSCSINEKYQIKNAKRICFVIETYEDFGEKIFFGENFTDTNECYEIIEGDKKELIDFFNTFESYE